MKLQEVLKRENNNLDLIRIMAAILVIWNHSFALSPLPDIKSKIIGGVAVPLFGFVSGLVITNSLFNKTNSLKFIVSIFCRLWIPLFITVFFAAFIIGPLFTIYDFNLYFTEHFKEIYIYINLLFQSCRSLPGVFLDNRYPISINGSLWVISLFFGSYLFFLAMKLLGLLRPSWRGFTTICSIMLLLIALKCMKINLLWSNENASFYIIFSILFGSLLCCLRNTIEVDKRLLVGALILYIIFYNTCLHYYFKLLLIFLACLCISYNRYFLLLKPKINVSLGLFLYAFPVQQAMSNIFMQSTPYFNFITSLIISIIIAILSHYFIERKAYKLADKINQIIDDRKWIL